MLNRRAMAPINPGKDAGVNVREADEGRAIALQARFNASSAMCD
jgi:hypothetical protein